MPAEMHRSLSRGSWEFIPCIGRRHSGRLLDGGANARIGRAAANIAGHGLINVGIGRLWPADEQSAGRHDLTGLAIAALHDIDRQPRTLNRAASRRGSDSLDGRDGRGSYGRNGRDAGSGGDAIQMHGASAAETLAAAELGAL